MFPNFRGRDVLLASPSPKPMSLLQVNWLDVINERTNEERRPITIPPARDNKRSTFLLITLCTVYSVLNYKGKAEVVLRFVLFKPWQLADWSRKQAFVVMLIKAKRTIDRGWRASRAAICLTGSLIRHSVSQASDLSHRVTWPRHCTLSRHCSVRSHYHIYSRHSHKQLYTPDLYGLPLFF